MTFPPRLHDDERPARVLVVVAVPAEAEAVRRGLGGAPETGVAVDVLVGGVGPAAVAAATAGALARQPYGLVVSAGIAGGFLPHAPIGSVVVAEEIVAADLGAQAPEGFLDVEQLGFGRVRHPVPAAAVRAAASALGAVTGTVLTVSTVTGSAERAAELTARHPRAVAEAMEGFGVAEAAVLHGTPALELRAVSNAVGPRDRSAWRIGEALAALERAFAVLPLPELLLEVTRG
ncbi:futalosine hydrolase [Kitasatospora sp. McL0602]|uniref:futalosine hydrolase n=1 Tax=Kitasatospora sp. McL0602 TaxID=3439530 RepID=UPI003F8BB93B